VSKNIYDLARDANAQASTSAPGFLGCEVEDAKGRILACRFDTTEHAQLFCDISSNRSIPNDRKTTVFWKMP